jgi:hypothetical protein
MLDATEEILLYEASWLIDDTEAQKQNAKIPTDVLFV